MGYPSNTIISSGGNNVPHCYLLHSGNVLTNNESIVFAPAFVGLDERLAGRLAPSIYSNTEVRVFIVDDDTLSLLKHINSFKHHSLPCTLAEDASKKLNVERD